MKKPPEQVVLMPVLTEKSVRLSADGKYVFFVAPKANKIEIAQAIEEIYNRGKKSKEKIQVQDVNVMNIKGKKKRTNFKVTGKRADRRKAIVTLMPGQTLEGFEV